MSKDKRPISSPTPEVVVVEVDVDEVVVEPMPKEEAPTFEMLKLTFWSAFAPI